jgi:NAD-dependent SIR2 family protein deacetylase
MFKLFCPNCNGFFRRPYEIRHADAHSTDETCKWCGCGLISTGVAFSEDYRSPLEPLVTTFHAENADLAIALGSSLCVQSSSMYPLQVVGKGNLVVVNAQHTPVDYLTNVRIFGKTDLFFELLMQELGITQFDRQTDVLVTLRKKFKTKGLRYK